MNGVITATATPERLLARLAAIKAAPAFSEYDYQHGGIVVRISGLLTPDQAAGYGTAVITL